MTNNFEVISGLVDNQADNLEESLQMLETDAALRSKWERYNLIKDVMHNEFAPTSSDFADRVSQAIRNEPAIVAFPAQADGTHTSSGSVSDLSTGPESRGKNVVAPIGWRRGATGFAVAASVAMLSLGALNMFQGENEVSGGGSTPILADNTGTAPAVIPVELVSNTGAYWVSTGRDKLSQDNENRLNMFLSEHIENSPTASVQGMLPYSRLAGYDSVRDEKR